MRPTIVAAGEGEGVTILIAATGRAPSVGE